MSDGRPVDDQDGSAATVVVRRNPAEHRFEVWVDGEWAGMTEYQVAGRQLLALTHTKIEPRFGGQGLASALISATLNELRTEQISVLPFCPFVKAFIEKHLDYLDLVPADSRSRFGLPAAADPS
ncbi:MAG: acetyltransferase-like protein [Frankiales bacterium]|nr:acetyltransferase-like protein [Frankiales bacterium]